MENERKFCNCNCKVLHNLYFTLVWFGFVLISFRSDIISVKFRCLLRFHPASDLCRSRSSSPQQKNTPSGADSETAAWLSRVSTKNLQGTRRNHRINSHKKVTRPQQALLDILVGDTQTHPAAVIMTVPPSPVLITSIQTSIVVFHSDQRSIAFAPERHTIYYIPLRITAFIFMQPVTPLVSIRNETSRR